MTANRIALKTVMHNAWRCGSLLGLGLFLTFAVGLSHGGPYKYNPAWLMGCVGAASAAVLALRGAKDLGIQKHSRLVHAGWQGVFGFLGAWLWWSGLWSIAVISVIAAPSAWLMPGASMRRVLTQVVACAAGIVLIYALREGRYWVFSPFTFAVRDLILFQLWWPRRDGPDSPQRSRLAMVGCVALIAALYSLGVRPPDVPDQERNPKERCC